MSEIIKECHDYASFWEKMPQILNNGHEFSLDVDFNPKSNTFKVNSFEEKFDHGWILDNSGQYPVELHCRILDGCQNVHEMLEARALEQQEALELDDFIHEHGNAMYKPTRYDRD